MSELKKYLQKEGIDQIEDDEEFCRAESEAVHDYCVERNFKLSDADMQTIRARRLEDSFDFWRENME